MHEGIADLSSDCASAEYQIKPEKLSKTELIRKIQSDEGNFNCFATAYSGECVPTDCLWRSDYFDASAS